ncbi:MAG: hypothetical protein J0I33_07640 [Microbacterium ginsengisoli]|uniref:hypothetical protein n=1 Tax=Microbacterium TaxID=33882 RepID=UPI0006FB330C|nr:MULTISPECIES: hypothetical protein [unclassified Microbacterium]KQR97673.1 hypothetical protein ASF93_13160 [Microbacterium sp. Leaf347]KQS01699.1 hypothetical protein ASG00_09675 [Microbacterium sp. Leaf351]MBN9198496.1 hypothetical protein [Microbacterium ginsengisoli]OJU78118.1 MAG: hypothetical protein BGO15_02645 [Microbacterium sp. 71-23]
MIAEREPDETEQSLELYIAACRERYAFDREYRARLQRELFDTDAHRSIQATLEAVRFETAMKRKAAA